MNAANALYNSAAVAPKPGKIDGGVQPPTRSPNRSCGSGPQVTATDAETPGRFASCHSLRTGPVSERPDGPPRSASGWPAVQILGTHPPGAAAAVTRVSPSPAATLQRVTGPHGVVRHLSLPTAQGVERRRFARTHRDTNGLRVLALSTDRHFRPALLTQLIGAPRRGAAHRGPHGYVENQWAHPGAAIDAGFESPARAGRYSAWADAAIQF